MRTGGTHGVPHRGGEAHDCLCQRPNPPQHLYGVSSRGGGGLDTELSGFGTLTLQLANRVARVVRLTSRRVHARFVGFENRIDALGFAFQAFRGFRVSGSLRRFRLNCGVADVDVKLFLCFYNFLFEFVALVPQRLKRVAMRLRAAAHSGQAGFQREHLCRRGFELALQISNRRVSSVQGRFRGTRFGFRRG